MNRISWSFVGVGCPVAIANSLGALNRHQCIVVGASIIAAHLVGFVQGKVTQ